ncbi:zinc finger protein 77-like [Pectinophora gossypiella]|uniref:zinc finger protein 77-like n=1 Tax=Pectinophora gossypiella TaxID=13191 RepID=UPI00214EB8E0|nr:zinc finger protein 77-like [Pectinophora gossypiella]
MELETMLVPSGVCAGCLSAGRRLQALAGEDLRYFEDIIHSGRGQPAPLVPLSRLAWQRGAAPLVTSHGAAPGDVTGRGTSPPALEFLKVEQDDDYTGDHYTEDHYDDKAVLKLDGADKPPKERKKRKKRARAREKTEFDSSDEEPLTHKQNKKHDDGGPQKRRPRREQPAGVVRHARVDKQLARLGVPGGAVQLVLLTWEEVEAERQRALQSARYTLASQRCEQCALGFNHSEKLRRHMLKHSPAAGGAGCGACGVRCRDARALAAHRRRHRLRWVFASDGETVCIWISAPRCNKYTCACRWRCVRCGALWSRAAVAADHVARAHGGAAPSHACRLCPHTDTSLGKLRAHVRRTHGAGARCERCGKVFADSASLRTHLFIHRGEKEHACSTCGKRFLLKRALQVHAATHQPSLALYCHQCDASFRSQQSYYQHARYAQAHAPRPPLLCPHCPRRCARAARLRDHIAAVHARAAPQACAEPGCGYVSATRHNTLCCTQHNIYRIHLYAWYPQACASRAVLRAHVLRAHRGRRPPRRHVCHRCGRVYTARKSLEAHLLSHAGLRPLACEACPARFTHRAALYNHTRLVHLKIKKGKKADPAPPAAAPEPPAASAEVSGAPAVLAEDSTAPADPPKAPAPPPQWLPAITNMKTDVTWK